MHPGALGLIAALLLGSIGLAASLPDPRSTPPNEDQFLDAPLPDVALTTADGRQIALASIARGRPLLFTFVFTRCAGVCSPFLASWRSVDRSLSPSPSFRRLVVSFDPRDTAGDMAALARHLDLDANPGWTFAIASPPDVERLARATGFWYEWDDSRQQFDHPAMIAAARDGRLVRLLVGGVVSSRRLDDLLREATGEFVPSYPLPGRVRFRCVQFDASTGRVTLDWGFLLLLVPMVAASVITLLLFRSGAGARRC